MAPDTILVERHKEAYIPTLTITKLPFKPSTCFLALEYPIIYTYYIDFSPHCTEQVLKTLPLHSHICQHLVNK